MSAFCRTSLASHLTPFCLPVFYLLVALLPIQVGKHWWLSEALTNGIRVDYLSIVLYATDLLTVLFIALWLGSGGYRQVHTLRRRYRYLLVSFIAVALLQLAWLHLPLTHLYWSIRIVIYGLFILAVSRVPWQTGTIGCILGWQTVFLASLVCVQSFTQRSLGGWLYWFGERAYNASTPHIALESMNGAVWVRPYGTFSHPNTLAGYVLLVGLWLLIIFKPKDSFQKWLRNVSLVAWLVIVLLAYSHAALITLGFTLAAAGALLLSPRLNSFVNNHKVIVSISLIAVSLLLPFGLLIVGSYYGSETVRIRNNLFLAYLSLLPRYGWLGFGWTEFFYQQKSLTLNYPLPVPYQPVHHSLWLLFGALGVIPLIVGIIAGNVHNYLRQLRWEWIILLSAVIILGSFDHYWLTQPQTLLLGSLIVGQSLKNNKALS